MYLLLLTSIVRVRTWVQAIVRARPVDDETKEQVNDESLVWLGKLACCRLPCGVV